MGYFGTIILTRSDTLVVQLPQIGLLGYRHHLIREFGDGWQLLETAGFDDPPDLRDGIERVRRAWAAPVLAAYTSGSDCAHVHWAQPDGPVESAHLPQPSVVKCGYLHRPPVDKGKPAEQVEQELTRWAEEAGLRVSPRRLAAAVGYTDDVQRPHLLAHEQVYELVRALGFPVFPAWRRREFNPEMEDRLKRFAGAFTGLAFEARIRAKGRRSGWADVPAEPAAWEAHAIQLQEDIFAAQFGVGHTFAELAARAAWVSQMHRAIEAGQTPPRLAEAHPVEDSAQDIANRRRLAQFWPTDSFAGAGVWPELA